MKRRKKSRFVDYSLNMLFKAGVFSFLRSFSPGVLTVLNYHRIADISDPGFDTFKPNVSATPETFALQMDYLKSNYNVITCRELSAWVKDGVDLPPHPAVVTFDDGYRDNLSNAYPILRDRGLTAMIFLSSGYMGGSAPFYWDLAAYAFYHSRKNSIQMPYGEWVTWFDDTSLDMVVNKWVGAVKYCKESERQRHMERLLAELDVAVPHDAFDGLYLDWDQVRELKEGGIEFGAHTVSHPILASLPLDLVEKELVESKSRIQSEIESPVDCFAYPNGGHADFSPEIVNLTKKAGYQLAFTLLPGPAPYQDVKKNPLTIPRAFLGNWDTMPRFAAKLTGIEKIKSMH